MRSLACALGAERRTPARLAGSLELSLGKNEGPVVVGIPGLSSSQSKFGSAGGSIDPNARQEERLFSEPDHTSFDCPKNRVGCLY